MVIDTEERKVLIVDDEALVRKLITTRLTREGYCCCEAASAEEALASIDTERPQLVLLDIMMPGKSGLDLLPELVASHPETDIIMATAVIESRTMVEAIRSGARDYLTKPFNLEQVVSTVRRVLEMKKLELQLEQQKFLLEITGEEWLDAVRRRFLGHIEELVDSLEKEDTYTAGHSRRVTFMAMRLGKELGLAAEQREDLRWAALLHDVGKIAIDPRIPNRPGLLTPSEYRHVLSHATVGAGIVKPVATVWVIDAIAHHHDRYDGTGVCQTVSGEDIPIGARIIAVADAFDAMTSARPYRAAMLEERAIEELKRCAGTQFDPAIVGALLSLLDVEGEAAA